MITIVDYGSGNVQAIKNIYKRLNVACSSASNAADLADAKKLILPGVGAFDDAVEKLEASGMREELDELVLRQGVPVLGVCVGMQIMTKSSEEGKLPGLRWVDATVKKFEEEKISAKPTLPHMGWNDIELVKDDRILDGVDAKKGFYFLHSFFVECANSVDVLTRTFYGSQYCSSFSNKNIYGFQFHPEKSHSNGVTLFKNFYEL